MKMEIFYKRILIKFAGLLGLFLFLLVQLSLAQLKPKPDFSCVPAISGDPQVNLEIKVTKMYPWRDYKVRNEIHAWINDEPADIIWDPPYTKDIIISQNVLLDKPENKIKLKFQLDNYWDTLVDFKVVYRMPQAEWVSYSDSNFKKDLLKYFDIIKPKDREKLIIEFRTKAWDDKNPNPIDFDEIKGYAYEIIDTNGIRKEENDFIPFDPPITNLESTHTHDFSSVLRMPEGKYYLNLWAVGNNAANIDERSPVITLSINVPIWKPDPKFSWPKTVFGDPRDSLSVKVKNLVYFLPLLYEDKISATVSVNGSATQPMNISWNPKDSTFELTSSVDLTKEKIGAEVCLTVGDSTYCVTDSLIYRKPTAKWEKYKSKGISETPLQSPKDTIKIAEPQELKAWFSTLASTKYTSDSTDFDEIKSYSWTLDKNGKKLYEDNNHSIPLQSSLQTFFIDLSPWIKTVGVYDLTLWCHGNNTTNADEISERISLQILVRDDPFDLKFLWNPEEFGDSPSAVVVKVLNVPSTYHTNDYKSRISAWISVNGKMWEKAEVDWPPSD
ncbi:hypothetical protein D4R99_03545, partial [bacterium]